ncbi:branched-chain amino acid ABC transporter permease [Aciduricibacillus chroicocephali]|uniref:Branched-chain amino acid ABC transporter permease n=1 Tax=Aciduricibacillus chroicocephali TaxID=3054939 RepID=A0ABY9KUB9_9BACI|nr:branched-chain amino acid ABC transporter permease [Bacillaceae bacterium 44XB]
MLQELVNPYYLQVLTFILINIILGLGMYVTLSTGQLSLGHAGFMAIGAYASGILTYTYEMPLLVGIIAGTLLAGIFGLIIGIPTLRLQGVYLAIATLGFGEVMRVIFVNWDSVTMGAVGLSGIPNLGRELTDSLRNMGIEASQFGLRSNALGSLLVFLLLLVIAIVIFIFFRRQNHSRVGRAFAAIKMDERAAEAMGINITYYKVLAFVQGAMAAGFAGAIYAHVTGYISPSDFDYHRAIDILIYAVFGGSEVVWGPVFGATFLTAVPEFLRGIAEYRYMIYGILLVVMMAFRPQGIIDHRVLYRFKRNRQDKKAAKSKKEAS